jgi:predicted metal-binding protein
MFSSSKRSKKKQTRDWRKTTRPLLFLVVCVLVSAGFVVHHTIAAYKESMYAATPIALDPNIGIKLYVEEFFTQNDATEMLAIINCESGFKQFNEQGEVLKNREGSSAVGIAQIIASKHPDQKVLDQYNKRNNTDLTVNDFDITTLMGNVGYALILYKVRGTRDWECAKK